ncbi:MAG TPA: SDR family NAD(P)-dependent oxidoreductase [Spirochaetota bacterium]|nr:SDR family NAD(P)-dependent oxidoreductase [Spirochaetota bacterium]HPU89269.1 SDR family NAD(P)-dependent oxidoreductase [Spirochaetota bacterium]
MKRFPEKRALITGAGSGLGRALALAFAKRGWRVAAADIDGARAEETRGAIDAAGGTGLAIRCDVTRRAEIEAARGIVQREFGGIDVLVNNAGIAAAGRIEDITPSEWDRIIAINLRGVIDGCALFVPDLRRQGGGHIVNVSSCAGIATLPEMASYNATKAAVIALSETLRVELAPHGIGVTACCPTFIKTNLMERFTATEERQRAVTQEFFDKSSYTAEAFAEHAIRSIEKNRMYAIPQMDGKLTWIIKRLFPETYYRVFAWEYARKMKRGD